MHRKGSSFHSVPDKPRFSFQNKPSSQRKQSGSHPSLVEIILQRQGRALFPVSLANNANISISSYEKNRWKSHRWQGKFNTESSPSLHWRLKTEKGLVHWCPFTDESYMIMLKRDSQDNKCHQESSGMLCNRALWISNAITSRNNIALFPQIST